MGIKFLCPNGHKLNVKSFLSGKKAICPKCGARVLVPQESEALSPGDTMAEGAITVVDDGATTAADAVSATPIAAASASTVEKANDPIAEAPSAVWYVRPATGGQFGPASGEIMRAWVAEGRVGASSLVWRAGWPEWRAASAIFPQLAGMLASPVVAVGPPRVAPVAVAPANGPGTSLPVGQPVQSVADVSTVPTLSAPSLPPLGPVVRRKRPNQVSTMVTLGLVVATVLLAITLYFVFPRQETPPETKTDQPGTAASSK